MARFVDIEGLRHFKTVILDVVQKMIDAGAGSDSDRLIAIQQYVALFNGVMGTELSWRDYADCTTAEVTSALDAMSKGYFGR